MNIKDILFDPNILDINMLKMHSIFPHLSLIDKRKEIKQSLNGNWEGYFINGYDYDFLALSNPHKELKDFKKIKVPLPSELQSGSNVSPQYVNWQYPFDGKINYTFDNISNIDNPGTIYVKDLSINKIDKDKDYIIRVGSFLSGLFVYVNGSFVGYSENCYLDSEFDITRYLNNGKNRILLVVYKYSSSSIFLDMDAFRFSGINRDVDLFALNKKRINDIFIKAKINGELKIEIDGNLEDCHFKYLLKGFNKNIKEKSDLKKVEFHFKENEFSLYSINNPKLYTVYIYVYDKNNNLVDLVCENFGFREVKIIDNVLCLNGERIIFKGLNRHEFDNRSGNHVSNKDLDYDFKFFNNHSVNAIRTSHYPNTNRFYDLADKNGIMVIDECALESHGTIGSYLKFTNDNSLPKSDSRYTKLCVTKIINMYLRDKNHPSIVLWSLGNESGSGSNFIAMKDAIKKMDPDILTHYENAYYDDRYTDCSDVFSMMYPTPTDIENILKKGINKPFILCEYAHSMGNSFGNIDEYIALTKKYRQFQGGFIWDYIDQSIIDKDGNFLYGGDFEDTPNDLDFSGNGIIYSRVNHETSKSQALKEAYFPMTIKLDKDEHILNLIKDDFDTDNSEVILELEYVIDKNKFLRKQMHLCFFNKNELNVHLDFDLSDYINNDVILNLFITFLPKGNKKKANKLFKSFLISEKTNELLQKHAKTEVFLGKNNIGVRTGKFTYLFSLSPVSFKMPGLYSIKIDDKELLKNPVYPTIFRAHTSNDIGSWFFKENQNLLVMSKYLTCTSNDLNFTDDENNFSISYKYSLSKLDNEYALVTYNIDKKTSVLQISCELSSLSSIKEIAQFGIVFPFIKDKSFKIDYLGLGPLDNYPDRLFGSNIGYFKLSQKNINDFNKINGYLNPQDEGTHMGTRYLELNYFNNSYLRFSLDSDTFAFKILNHSDFEIENAHHEFELPNSNTNYLTISGFLRGVGGDNSWGADVHEKYKLQANKTYKFSFFLQFDVI